MSKGKINGTSYSTFCSMLSEGFHTAFRKASDDPVAREIWKLIRDLDDKEWSSVISFVADPTWDEIAREKS